MHWTVCDLVKNILKHIILQQFWGAKNKTSARSYADLCHVAFVKICPVENVFCTEDAQWTFCRAHTQLARFTFANIGNSSPRSAPNQHPHLHLSFTGGPNSTQPSLGAGHSNWHGLGERKVEIKSSETFAVHSLWSRPEGYHHPGWGWSGVAIMARPVSCHGGLKRQLRALWVELNAQNATD